MTYELSTERETSSNMKTVNPSLNNYTHFTWRARMLCQCVLAANHVRKVIRLKDTKKSEEQFGCEIDIMPNLLASIFGGDWACNFL
jgi:hypothetical protein